MNYFYLLFNNSVFYYYWVKTHIICWKLYFLKCNMCIKTCFFEILKMFIYFNEQINKHINFGFIEHYVINNVCQKHNVSVWRWHAFNKHESFLLQIWYDLISLLENRKIKQLFGFTTIYKNFKNVLHPQTVENIIRSRCLNG